MKGGSHRYIVENTGAYNETIEISNDLHYIKSEKLGLLLNLSFFYYEVASNPKEAYSLYITEIIF